jgi:hypothetical protein
MSEHWDIPVQWGQSLESSDAVWISDVLMQFSENREEISTSVRLTTKREVKIVRSFISVNFGDVVESFTWQSKR